jgi:hypothetical protein
MGGPIVLLPLNPLVYNLGMGGGLVEMHRNLILLMILRFCAATHPFLQCFDCLDRFLRGSTHFG